MEALLWIGGLAIAGLALFFGVRKLITWEGLAELAKLLFNALLPAIAKRMPPDEEDAWNKFMRSNPDKYEIAKWRKAYRKRRKDMK